MKTVAIIEDQTAIREMVSQAVIDPSEYNVIIESGDGQIGCDSCLEQKPEFVILDVMLPNLNGTEILRIFREKIPETQVLIFSGYQSPSLVRELLQAGAHGFVEKSAPLSELRKGIEIVSNGGSYFGPEVALLLREAMADPRSSDSGINILTKREREILQLIAESHSTRDIAAKLSISVKTAENHRTNLMRKLDLHDVASLTRYAINNGLISIGN
ncbi:response regulator transcription factor [Coraliomargarita sp. SDUM461003]|uniref:Response regulator transcription factor n=1 Tax=Thalassobacterium maritimum TaxID=3041265 RepID=A0ABU1AV23_9BACT|nr:response regulator transcription factor [Coraliomargarita sp. SDUM461003]MBT64933.1 DNA-binding response regulator [Puniceicoccaceae bacterium]MDQ8208006.1 response regulator transcription factor [Coraliomargarita sp. SDUM461003]HBR94165.1 DNA-binding response regulator [Opitutae bacterium]|tara:strand:- start:464 stop:1108 length:645 start_codon:yes stop_codon:yes gene_type:complete